MWELWGPVHGCNMVKLLNSAHHLRFLVPCGLRPVANVTARAAQRSAATSARYPPGSPDEPELSEPRQPLDEPRDSGPSLAFRRIRDDDA